MDDKTHSASAAVSADTPDAQREKWTRRTAAREIITPILQQEVFIVKNYNMIDLMLSTQEY